MNVPGRLPTVKLRALVVGLVLGLLGPIAGLGMTTAAPLSAQEPVAPGRVVEEQVALDAAGTLLRMDADLARQLGLFPEVPGLREVLLFLGPAGYTLELTSRRDGVLVRERRSLSAAEAVAFREQVGRLLAQRAPVAVLDRTGRYLLLGTATAAGLGFYGWAVPSIFDVDGTRGQIALYMLVSSASFIGPWLWSEARPVTYGMANAAFWGGSRGIAHGLALHRVIEGPAPEGDPCPDLTPQCYERNQEARDAWERRRLATALVMSLGEGIGALSWARSQRVSAGDAHLVGALSDFGAAWGAGLAVTLGADDSSTAPWGAGLAGAAAGVAGGLVFAERRDYSWGDAEVFRTAGLLGGYSGAVAADLFGANDPEVFAGLAIAGSVGGLLVGDRLVRGQRLTPGESVLVDLGSVAGGLLGLGLAFLATDETDDPTPHLVASAVGAGAGFAITYGSVVRWARGESP